jgi:hypothetical protein
VLGHEEKFLPRALCLCLSHSVSALSLSLSLSISLYLSLTHTHPCLVMEKSFFHGRSAHRAGRCAPSWYMCRGSSICDLLQGSGFRVQGSGFRVQGSGFRVQGSGFRVQGVEGPGGLWSGFREVSAQLVNVPRLQHLRPYITQCINQIVSESQLPHKIVNLSFTITD